MDEGLGLDSGELDLIVLYDGSTMQTHGPRRCGGQACVIHAPSDHLMRTWPLTWRREWNLMERVCRHGVGHPDPDSLAWLRSRGISGMAVHGCDGCCQGRKG